MPEKKIPTSFEVQLYGDLVPYSSTISKARVRIFYRGLNRNGSYISEEFAEKLIKTLPYAPVKGIYDEEGKDYTDHGNGIKSLGKAYGVVPENNNGSWELHMDNDGVERLYYCSDVLLWTSLYEVAKSIPGKAQSMELDYDSVKGEWTDFGDFIAYKVTDGCFLGLQVLGTINGEEVEPCFEGSAFYTKQADLNYQFSEIIKIAKNYNSQKEDIKMPEEKQNVTPELENSVADTSVNGANTDASFEANEGAGTDAGADVGTDTGADTGVDAGTDAGTGADTNTGDTGADAGAADTSTIDASAGATVVISGGADNNANTGTDYQLKFNELTASYNELNEKFTKLSDEFSVLTDKFNHLQAERDSLAEYKVNAENEEKNQVLDKYSNILKAEVIQSYKEKLNDFSVIELEKELCFEAHKDDTFEPDTANFSYKNNGTVEMTPLMSCLNDYRTE